MEALPRARAAAAGHLKARGYSAEAHAIEDGSGDDFAEVRIALQLLSETDVRIQRLELALTTYAAPEFWEEFAPGSSDASEDGGEIARHALAGTPVPGRYHD